ncbi:hypothetical protein [Portibacter marinus]|uniref:hypothetical protein n=1 Tax=Portibacter marinus TaxID=2898660 RepID=UPI001F22A5C8|nr:hypothetical protein [Portibacter marinus]
MRLIYPIIAILLWNCNPTEKKAADIINGDHLHHLYESFVKDGKEIGTIWIYCEAPDYHLVTDDDEGYTCVDDVARSLVFYAKEYENSPNDSILNKIIPLTRFVLDMQAENGFFYNFIFPDKSINKTHENSVAEANWWSWRAFWSLSELMKLENAQLDDIKIEAQTALDDLLPHMIEICVDRTDTFMIEGISSPICIREMGGDQVALVMIGLSNYYKLHPDQAVRDQLINLGEILMAQQLGAVDTFPYYASMSWQNIWHGWGNSQAYALLKTGAIVNDDRMIEAGLREVLNFFPHFLSEKPSYFRLAKSPGGYEVLETDRFPQIAYNLRPMIYAAIEAYRLDPKEEYKEIALELGDWFFGSNQAGVTMYDYATGRTFDGIVSPEQVNRNSGAESTIEALLSIQALREFTEWTNRHLKK